MIKLSKNTLTSFECWSRPTLNDVEMVVNKLNLSEENFTKNFGLSDRTLRRWTAKKNNNRQEISKIPYGVWCVFIALSENKIIFTDVKKRDLSTIPNEYFCTWENFTSPGKDVLTKFIGKNSITGLPRSELAKIFGWNSVHLGSEFNKGKISYLNWVLLLLFSGEKVQKFIKLK